MPRKLPYCCPRCNYTTDRKASMRQHLYLLAKICPGTHSMLVLTDNIKQHIMDNRVYLSHQAPQKKSKANISKALRMKIWETYIGLEKGIAKCCCCETTDMSQFNFHCGHVIAESIGGLTTFENLRPICQVCNGSMGTMNMFEFKQKYFSESLANPLDSPEVLSQV